MTGTARREQLIEVARELFAERGFDGTSIEEVAQRGQVSKPVVYEHFGGKEGLYAVVVDREMRRLLDRIVSALSAGHPRELLLQAADAFLGYIDENAGGFRVLVRDSPASGGSGMFSSLLGDIAGQVEHVLGREFALRGVDASLAALYSQALVGMVALTGQWWLDVRSPGRDEVAGHLVNLAWHGLSGIDGMAGGARPAGVDEVADARSTPWLSGISHLGDTRSDEHLGCPGTTSQLGRCECPPRG
ncbi:MAG TPA: TetR/AcrR family transcriptional regulator [Pseudonocardia sp.]|nr:TetR/AcrR family transcriptional regulator [Pseudonocardia sp.]